MSSRVEPENMTQTTISVETLRELLDRGEPVTVLDMRRADARAGVGDPVRPVVIAGDIPLYWKPPI